MIIVGEAHQSTSSVATIDKMIRASKPKILIHELIWDYSGVGKGISPGNLKKIPQYQEGFNEDIFKLANELKVDHLLGCDLSEAELEKIKSLSLADQFAKREQRMLNIALRYSGREDVFMVVGDIHLRSKTSKDLPIASLLQLAVKEGKLEADIVRAPSSLREHL